MARRILDMGYNHRVSVQPFPFVLGRCQTLQPLWRWHVVESWLQLALPLARHGTYARQEGT